MENILLSIICPVLNEEKNIDYFYNRFSIVIKNALNKKLIDDYELIFTNNASTDHTLEKILKIKKENNKVKIISFSRNFGKNASMIAGLEQSKGNKVVILDVDCEDPPELLINFLEKMSDEDFDIIYGQRSYKKENYIMQFVRYSFYRILKILSDHETILDCAEFFLITSEVKNNILKNKSSAPFIRNELGYVGYKKYGYKYERNLRQYGRTHYGLIDLFFYAVSGILTSSTLLLLINFYIGLSTILIDLIYLLFFKIDIQSKIFSLFIFMNLFFLIFSISSLSIYVARIYKDNIKRPLYVIDIKKTFIE